MEPDPLSDVSRPVRRLNPTVLALLAGIVIPLLVIAYFAIGRNPDQDRLTQNGVAQSQQQVKAPVAEKVCASNRTYDLIKRELFRRAAQMRGSDQAAFDQLSGYAVVRMENPVMESQDSTTGATNCSGSLSLDLPPGVGIVGGRRTLTADVDYTVQQAADGSGTVVVLRNADAIIGSLATLARVNEPVAVTPPEPVATNGAAPGLPPTATPQPAQSPKPATPTPGAHPSFDCSKARTKGEIAVCSNGGLAALDRNMAGQYAQAIAGASPEQRTLLRRTRDRFIAYRDRCPNRPCMGDAYVGRMREIRDIMEGHWQPR